MSQMVQTVETLVFAAAAAVGIMCALLHDQQVYVCMCVFCPALSAKQPFVVAL